MKGKNSRKKRQEKSGRKDDMENQTYSFKQKRKKYEAE